MKHSALCILFLSPLALLACADDTHPPDRGEIRSAQNSKTDGPDLCEGVFYGDGEFCDCWCPEPDPDCEAGLPLWEECEAPAVECDDATPCATCAGLDCPVMDCVDGRCVAVDAVECDDTTPCATCAGLDCPVVECVDNRCVEAEAAECSDDMPCATCAGLDCPVMECLDGRCVAVAPVECDEQTPCATCAGLDCPVMDCVDGTCVEVAQDLCPDPRDPDVIYEGFTADECTGSILCSNNEEPFNIPGCGCGCIFTL